MAPFALDLLLRLTGVRGQIPRFDDFRPVPATPSTRAAGRLLRALAIAAAVFAALSLAVWGTVWLAIRLL
ncbi:hypothetical protein AB8Z38_31400 [Bradyrhizobium sp. LLZ17]|uniref:Uncharacterized protein n=1 Tax=Bradyrhizobium sp. LLZ17 TaxID=3239388 RepID=A0AB39XVU6_9BRAD